MTAPLPVCVGCSRHRVSVYELVCDECRPQFEAAGLLAPRPKSDATDERIQIGPTDI